MRTTIEIDEALIEEAMRRLGVRTKTEIVGIALRRLLEQEKRKDILEFFGSGVWEGDLGDLRGDRPR